MSGNNLSDWGSSSISSTDTKSTSWLLASDGAVISTASSRDGNSRNEEESEDVGELHFDGLNVVEERCFKVIVVVYGVCFSLVWSWFLSLFICHCYGDLHLRSFRLILHKLVNYAEDI